ncbi:MAG: DegT/DnrJ/EryC1/StrS aminotransferase family protein, partial [Planctomycetota bacterium]
AGWPCEMADIVALARRHNLAVIEDCAQAHGAEYRGRRCGALGDIAAFSFCQDKIMTTGGEGGMLTTNDPQLWRRAWSYKDHGKDWDRVHAREPHRVFRWLHGSVGTNWRMTEMQAAIGRVQLRRLPAWLQQRARLASVLNEQLIGQPGLRIAVPPPHVRHAYYKFYAFLTEEVLTAGWTRDEIVRAVQALGVPCGSGICPAVYRESAFRKLGIGPSRPLPVAERLGETSLMLLVHPTLSEAAVRHAGHVLRSVVQAAIEHAPPARRAA